MFINSWHIPNLFNISPDEQVLKIMGYKNKRIIKSYAITKHL